MNKTITYSVRGLGLLIAGIGLATLLLTKDLYALPWIIAGVLSVEWTHKYAQAKQNGGLQNNTNDQ